ncbi:MAG TPA: sulfotransferase domain-containing protein [Opitutaceae bacterium]|nr:sulfotransferase domain-containing protein [Opitutaceae bacterium]
MKGIVWLASYPKSGNTWFRMFLANYLRDGDQPINFDDLQSGLLASARETFDQLVGYDSGEMTFDEIDSVRPDVYRYQAEHATETPYCKIHDAFILLPDGRPLVPLDATACVLYFIRNPLDVAVSFAHHHGHDRFDRIVRAMGNAEYALCGSPMAQANQLRQKLLTWSGHVTSWTEAPGLRVHVVRFEDMKRDSVEAFGGAIRFLGLGEDETRLRKAIAFSRFEELKRQETCSGFPGKSPQARSFFRKGEVGSWRGELNPAHVAQLVADHRDVMRRFGYLGAREQPVF